MPDTPDMNDSAEERQDFFFGDSELADAIDAAWDGQAGTNSPIWLDNLGNLLRYVGLNVIEEDGWERRSRSNDSGYARKPTHVMFHHTASDTSAANDVAYMTYNSDVAPIANLYFARNGDVHLMAGGPTNTNGKGTDSWGGGVPDDSMNSYAVGFEIGNNGIGEAYPEAQLNAAYLAGAAVLVGLDEPVGHLRSHFEWAPGRKVDPAGPPNDTAATPGLQWDMDSVRGIVFGIMSGGELPPVPPAPTPPAELPTDYAPPTAWSDFPEDCNKDVIRQGSENGYVRYFQDAVYYYGGGDITRDGEFGPESDRRARDLQRFFGFPEAYIDGIVGWDGGNCASAGQYATWLLVDFLVNTNTPTEPEVPPGQPVTGVNPTADALYYVRAGDSPWAAGERIWRDGSRGAQELPPEMFYEPDVLTLVPGVSGVWMVAQSGDSPYSMIRTMGGDPAVDLERFYDFNGPDTRVIQVGDAVFLADTRPSNGNW